MLKRDSVVRVCLLFSFASYKPSSPFIKKQFILLTVYLYVQGATCIFLCSDDYVKITNNNGQTFGVFCRQMTGKVILVTGASAFITFHSDFFMGRSGFRLLFIPVSFGMYSVSKLCLPLVILTGCLCFIMLSFSPCEALSVWDCIKQFKFTINNLPKNMQNYEFNTYRW